MYEVPALVSSNALHYYNTINNYHHNWINHSPFTSCQQHMIVTRLPVTNRGMVFTCTMLAGMLAKAFVWSMSFTRTIKGQLFCHSRSISVVSSQCVVCTLQTCGLCLCNTCSYSPIWHSHPWCKEQDSSQGANDLEGWVCTVAQKGHTCKLKVLLQIKNSACKLKIVHAN